MPDQGAVIKEIDLLSGRAAGRYAPWRLLAVPAARFLGEIILKGGFARGARGLKDAWNGWALAFVTEAKLYEKARGDREKPVAESRDFLGGG